MEVKTFNVYRGTEILNRPNGWEGVPITLDFTEVEDKVDGVKIVKAGTPIDKDGKKTATDAVGILLSDVFEGRPIGTVLKKGYLNKKRVDEHAGEAIPEAVLGKLPMIVVEEDGKVAYKAEV